MYAANDMPRACWKAAVQVQAVPSRLLQMLLAYA